MNFFRSSCVLSWLFTANTNTNKNKSILIVFKKKIDFHWIFKERLKLNKNNGGQHFATASHFDLDWMAGWNGDVLLI